VVGFFINIMKLFGAVWHGIKHDETFRILLAVLLTFLIGGTYFYWSEEGWSVVDGFYFCVMTMSTIGQSDLVPTSDLSKIFTTIYAVLSIGVFAAVTAKLVIITVSHKKDAKQHKKHSAEN
jgi:hypothetical protein